MYFLDYSLFSFYILSSFLLSLPSLYLPPTHIDKLGCASEGILNLRATLHDCVFKMKTFIKCSETLIIWIFFILRFLENSIRNETHCSFVRSLTIAQTGGEAFV